jgi:hypothetical protein
MSYDELLRPSKSGGACADLIANFNHLSQWTATEIVGTPNVQQVARSRE